VDTLINQIKIRGREYEQNIERTYLEELNKSYDKWVTNYKIGKCITIETDNLDFVNNKDDFERITGIIAKSLI
jgi:Deoxynucleoside kinases